MLVGLVVVVCVVGRSEKFSYGMVRSQKPLQTVPLHNTAITVPLLSTCTIQHGCTAFDSIPQPLIESIDDLSHRRTSECERVMSNEQIYGPSQPLGRSPAEHAVTRHQLSNTKKNLAAWTTPYGFPVSSQGVVTLGEGLVTGA